MVELITLILVALGSVLFGLLALWALSEARAADTPRYRRVLVAIGSISAFVLAGGLLSAVVVAGHLGVVPDEIVAPAVTAVGVALASAGLILGLWGFRLMAEVGEDLRDTDRLVETLLGRVPDVRLEDIDLTGREREVVQVMIEGWLSDKEIAERLDISPATAATHVRNILRKTELGNRRELMLVGLAAERRSHAPRTGMRRLVGALLRT